MDAHTLVTAAKANSDAITRVLLILSVLLIIGGFIVSPLIFVLLGVPLVILVGVPIIIVLMVSKQQNP